MITTTPKRIAMMSKCAICFPFFNVLNMVISIKGRLLDLGYDRRDVEHEELRKHRYVWKSYPLSERSSYISSTLCIVFSAEYPQFGRRSSLL